MPFHHSCFHPVRAAATLGMLLILSGCDSNDASKPVGQSVAKVNGVEITVHQLNQEILKTSDRSVDIGGKVSEKVLDNLVNQTLLAQKAQSDELDRDPQVMQEIERSRRQILGAAYLERKTATVPPPDAAEIKTFFEKHPALFAQRKIYVLQRITVDSDIYDHEMKQQLASAITLDETANWLESRKIGFTQETVVDPAERLPLDLLNKVSKLDKGQVLVLNGPGKVAILQLLEKIAQPISFNQARPAIEQFLANEKRRQQTKQEIEQIRASAKIELLGNPATNNNPPKSPSPATKSIDKGMEGLGV